MFLFLVAVFIIIIIIYSFPRLRPFKLNCIESNNRISFCGGQIH